MGMFKTIEEGIDWIQSRRNTGHTFDNFKQVCNSIGNPQNSFYTIHVAGTDGKGSTVAYLRDLLMNQGYKVGTLQSPHYITHLDRIRINNQNIPADIFLNILNKNYDFFINNDMSMFEMDYLIMCEYFKNENIDFAIIEVGIGGRLDATNVVDNTKLSIITTIGYDHMELLGDTLPLICKEKCGIIKNNSKVLIGHLNEECKKVVKDVAKEKNAEYIELQEYKDLGNRQFEYEGNVYSIFSYADYQLHNACLSLKAFNIIAKDYGINVDNEKVKYSLANTLWQNRFEIVKQNPTVILDGAHNIHGIEAVCKSFDKFDGSKCIVFSALKRKEYKKMAETLKEHCDKLIITTFDSYGVIDINDFKMFDTNDSYIDAIDYAIKNYENVLICGSLYFLSDVVLNYRF